MTTLNLSAHVIPNAEAIVRVGDVEDTGERVDHGSLEYAVFAVEVLEVLWEVPALAELIVGDRVTVSEPDFGTRTFDDVRRSNEFVLVLGDTEYLDDWPAEWVLMLGAREGPDGRLVLLSSQSQYSDFVDSFEQMTVETLVARFERERG